MRRLLLWGSNQDSPAHSGYREARASGQVARKQSLTGHRSVLPSLEMPAFAG
jgi:hypothetical protein